MKPSNPPIAVLSRCAATPEQRLRPRQETADRNSRRQKASGKRGPFEDDAGDGDNRIHAPTLPCPNARVARGM
jgi:hypothetical protein